VTIVCDPQHLPRVAGAIVDYSEDGRGFTIALPNPYPRP
jgi:hypothetical protein